ncbi:MAG TPA: glycosyltransferase [Candidatus Aminicenantes bacterium]|nr:glycosyltransferase [Candidatus Aminicenantes bacterium]HRY65747.1 glycosyltransferase [Candidatus Aminicenantes bacterium]HRZ72661.1 glycosyltransferase [Candidatus Aminicenantes bacterium]
MSLKLAALGYEGRLITEKGIQIVRIAYIFIGQIYPQTGVGKKVRGQVEAWKEMGHAVEVFDLPVESIDKGKKLVPSIKMMIRRLREVRRLSEKIRTWSPDILYARAGLTYYPSLDYLFRDFPVVFEVNTDEIREYKLTYSPFKYVFFVCTRRRYLSQAAAFICVTKELNEKYLRYRKPIKIISNGIKLSDYPILHPVEKEHMELVFVGNDDYPWNGIDVICEMAGIFPSWEFNIIGMGKQNGCPRNVHFRGKLSYPEYMYYYQRADVSIGTLALNRKGMKEASPLKVREYLAHGIPVIIGYEDTDFPNGAEFILRIASDLSDPRGISAIKEFVMKWRGKRIDRNEVQSINSPIKERERMAFLEWIMAADLAARDEHGKPIH